MDMAERIPSFTDQQLAIMLGNAERLEQSGTKKQKGQAAHLLPLIMAEIDDRRARSPMPLKAVRRPRKS